MIVNLPLARPVRVYQGRAKVLKLLLPKIGQVETSISLRPVSSALVIKTLTRPSLSISVLTAWNRRAYVRQLSLRIFPTFI